MTEPQWRDHDHSAEAAVLEALNEPTPENTHAAELAVALLQRRYDYALRRLGGGDGELPPYPIHQHNAADQPTDCLSAALHELAGGPSEDRAETLAHGLTAAQALESQRDDARRLAVELWGLLPPHARDQIDPDEYLWTPSPGRGQPSQ